MNARAIWKSLVMLAFALFLGACATNPGHVTPTMADADFIKAAPAERVKYLKDVEDEDSALTSKKGVEYVSGRPVYYGNEKTGYTLLWDKKLSLLHVFPGHNPGAMSLETQGVLTLRTDAKGNIFYQKDGSGVERPTTLLSNVATQEGIGRVILKGGFQVLGAVTNGALAAEIAKCKDCGDTWNIQGGQGGQGGHGGQGGVGLGVGVGGNSAAGSSSQSGSSSTAAITSTGSNCGNACGGKNGQ
jgi:hypothetical protein